MLEQTAPRVLKTQTVTLQTAQGAAGDGIEVDVREYERGAVQVVFAAASGITVNFEGTVDGVAWQALAPINAGSTTEARATTTAADGIFLFDKLVGILRLRARVSVSSPSGDVSVYGSFS